MLVPKIHSLNVKNGDCFLLERSSGRVTMIDICCGNYVPEVVEAGWRPPGDYNMRDKPTNPIDYLTSIGISMIWRFILTHPDMDHMDGIKALFSSKTVHNFWDCGVRKDKPDFEGSPYKEEDWDWYADIIAGRAPGVNIVHPRAGSKGKYWNADNDQGTGDGDYISVISPDKGLIDLANTDGGDVNDASYVFVYRSSAGKIIFPGDSNDKTWEYILRNHRDDVSNAAVLFAPHHGRKSGRDYAFLDVVKPRISFFGCAPSEDLAYSAWSYRKLPYFTNNQCGNIHIYPEGTSVHVFIENKRYADVFTGNRSYERDGYWFLCEA